jgi:hypothetical protein
MEYMEFKQTFKDKVHQESHSEKILLTARRLLTKDKNQEAERLEGYLSSGFVSK